MRLFIFLSIILISIGVNAQSMFKPIPKIPAKTYGFSRSLQLNSTTKSPDSTFTGFRFTGPMVLYSLPGSAIYTGVGIDWEKDTWNAATNKWYSNYAIALGGYEGGQFAPNSVQAVTAVGLSIQLLNKLLVIGVLYSITDHKIQGGVGPSVSLNN